MWLKFFRKIYLLVWKSELERGKRRQRFLCCFMPLSWCQSWGQVEAPARGFRVSHVLDRNPYSWGVFSCDCQAFSGELGQKRNSRDTNSYPGELLASQGWLYPLCYNASFTIEALKRWSRCLVKWWRPCLGCLYVMSIVWVQGVPTLVLITVPC